MYSKCKKYLSMSEDIEFKNKKQHYSMYDIEFKHFPKEVVQPTLLADSEKFLIKLAETEEELKKTLHLRYKVFNLELGAGLKSVLFTTGLDVDEFDEYCLQMIVVNKATNEPVGTYRVHLGSVASNAKGFYSSSEYTITGLEKIAYETIELGRSCVLPEYRTGAIIALLWGGIGELMMRAKLRYLMGCVSFEKKNAAAAWAIYDHFKKDGIVDNTILWGEPKEKYRLKRPSAKEIKPYSSNLRGTLKEFLPPLLIGYFRLGTKICGEPLYDSDFGSIDFLILLDTFTVPERYTRHYNYNP
jgi:putative hemolysin